MERWMVLSLLVSLFLTTEAAISVTKLHVQSVITHRFSTTTVKSLLINEGEEAQEATFDVRLPKDAFISNFSMLIDGQVYPGEIAEKEKARKIYQAAVEQGQSAGHVRASPRQSNKFAVSVNVEAGNNVTFDLTYQELLVRRLGVYEHVIYIDPGQIVEDLMVEVYISESRVITELSVPRITNDLLTDEIIDDTNDLAMIEMLSESSAYVSFWPAEDEQEQFSAQGISGQFIVNYDVEHESDGVGEILVSDGYFVHYFAPVWLEPINKRIMFVLDTSGSMSGTKINQLKQALVTILEELNPADEFGIITFSSGVNPWKGGEILPASERIVQSAIEYAGELRASGGTNIDMAMERGLHILSQYSKETASMLIFLTDGQATSGETRDSKILENIRASNKDKFASIFCLGFGRGADFGLLQKIAGQNNGVARKIFEDADASLQLAGFYDEISSPLLSELKITYIGGIDNTSLTETDLHCLFDGSEMVVAGRLNVDYHNYSSVNNTGPVMNLTIEGNHVNTLVVGGQIDLVDTYIEDIPKLSPESIRDFTHRLWVYLTIKQLIDTTQQTTDPDKAKLAKAKALELSLRYGFVTPFTSMVVTKPGDEDKKEVVGEDKGVSHFEAERAPSGRSRPNYPVYAQSLPVPQSGSQGVYHSAVSYNSPGSYHSPALSWNPPQSGPVGMAGLPARPTTLPPATYTTTTTTRLYTWAATRGTPGIGLRVNMKKKMPRPPRPTAPVSYDYNAPSGNKKKAKKTPKGNVYGPAIAIETLPQKGSVNNRRVLCFDLPKDLTQSTLSLLQTNDLNLTGTPSSSYGDAKKFNEITLRAANKTLVFTSKGVTVDSGKLAAWWRLKFMKVDGWKVLADGVLRIQFGSNSSLVIQKHGIQSRRSRAKPFLTLGISPVDGDIQGASGILGDLFRPQYLSIKRNKVYFDAQKAQVSPFDKYKLPTGRKCFRLLKMDTVKQLLKI